MPGLTRVLVSLCLSLLIVLASPSPGRTQESIDLGDITAGGSGRGDAPAANIGINADTGAYESVRLNANVTDTNFTNPQPVDGSDGAADNPLINSVFIMDFGFGQVINTEEVAFDFEPGDEHPNGWEAILNGLEPGGPDLLTMGVRPDGTNLDFFEGIGLHASQGITFDLAEMRLEHTDENVRYVSAIAGECSGQPNGSVNTYIILTDDEAVLDQRTFFGATNEAGFLQMEIPEEALYLTFAVGAAGNLIGADHGGFALARITSEEVETEITGISVSPTTLVLDVAESRQLEVSGILGGELDGIATEISLEDIAFESDDAGIAEVDDEGNVLGESPGETTVRVTVGDTTVDVPVTVVGQSLDLGDMVGNGDGTGTAEGFLIGIDPRNGLFTEFAIGGHIYEGDFEGDGLDPSPVDDSPFVDAVFIIGERAPGAAAVVPIGGPPVPQELTTEGKDGPVFEFRSEEAFGSVWNMILMNNNGGITDGVVTVGGQNYETGVGVHAAGGITFNLEEIRDEFGEDAVGTFSTIAGMDGCGCGNVNLYVILSSEDEVLFHVEINALPNEGEPVLFRIPAAAQYLTLATGSNGPDCCDHGTFADARLLSGPGLVCPAEGDTHCDSLRLGEVGDPGFTQRYPVEVLAEATDDSGDSISYNYTLVNPDGSELTGTRGSRVLDFFLMEGAYSLTVVVDDEVLCTDAADDNSCTLEFSIPPEEMPEEDCDTEGDEDDNGLADCDDPACAEEKQCQVGGFRRGDSDDNASVQLTDAVNILGFLFQGSAMPTCLDAADADDNGQVQLTDAVRILGFLFQGTAPPPAPGPIDCGSDPSDDGLECAEYLSCE